MSSCTVSDVNPPTVAGKIPPDVIDFLASNSFVSIPQTIKADVIAKGRPTPYVDITSPGNRDGKLFIKTFNTNAYKTCSWLCGSVRRRKLYCWPCLLFSTEVGLWIKNGYSDLNNFSSAVRRHEKCLTHIEACVQLQLFGRSRGGHQPESQRRTANAVHNENVRKNRDVLKRLIDVACVLAKQELPFSVPAGCRPPDDRGNYVELTQLLRDHDPLFSERLDSAPVFSGLSFRFQNTLIESMVRVVLKEVKCEIDNAKFVAVLLEAAAGRISTSLRYVDDDGAAHERFIVLTDFGCDRSPTTIGSFVINLVKEFNCIDKVIAQSCDGSPELSGPGGVHTRLKELLPKAPFFHSTAHDLCFVLSQACCHIRECASFFQTLNGLESFFSQSPSRLAALRAFPKSHAQETPILWDFSPRRSLDTVHSNRGKLLDFLVYLYVGKGFEIRDAETVNSARGFVVALNSFQFVFFLNLFVDLFDHTDMVSAVTQREDLDILLCTQGIKHCIDQLQGKILEFDGFWDRVCRSCDDDDNDEIEASDDHKVHRQFYSILYGQVLQTLINVLTQRFANLENLRFLELLNSRYFGTYTDSFPEDSFNSLRSCYSNRFDWIRLKNELIVAFRLEEFKSKSPSEISLLMKQLNLIDSMPEFYSLLSLFLSMPCTNASDNPSFSAHKRVHAFCRRRQNENLLFKLSLLSIEKQFLCHLKETKEDFYDNVIIEFQQDHEGDDLTYK